MMTFRSVAGVVILAAALVGGGWTQASFAEESARSNLDLMTAISTDVSAELIEQFAAGLNGRGVRLKPFTAGEQYQFLGNVFTTLLASRGITVFQNAPQGTALPGDVMDLQYQAVAFNVAYTSVHRSHLIGGRRIGRSANVRIVATLIRPEDGAVVAIGDATRHEEDDFPHAELKRVEEGSFEFARPPLPPSGWGKYVEPVVVSGIVVGLIYLFFSNQSGN